MHPNRFFDECSIRSGVDTVEVFDEELRAKLKNTHPKNFIKTRIELPIYEIKLEYFTEKEIIKMYTDMQYSIQKTIMSILIFG